MSLQRLHERGDPRRATGHPRRRRTGWRGRELDVGADLQAHEGPHRIGRGKLASLVELLPVRVGEILVGEIGGGLVEREAEQASGVRGRERERHRAAAGVAIEMEPIEPDPIRGHSDAFDLERDGVTLGRRVTRVHLEILRERVDVAQMFEQRRVPDPRGGDDSRQEDGSHAPRLQGLN